jgi:hypothetical protein
MLLAGNIGQFGAPGTVVPGIRPELRDGGSLRLAVFEACALGGVLAGVDRLGVSDAV